MFRNLSRGSRVLQRQRIVQQRYHGYEKSGIGGSGLVGAAIAGGVGLFLLKDVMSAAPAIVEKEEQVTPQGLSESRRRDPTTVVVSQPEPVVEQPASEVPAEPVEETVEVVEVVEEVVEPVAEVIEEVTEAVSEVVESVEEVAAEVAEAVQSIEEVATEIVEDVAEVVETAADVIEEVAEVVVEAVETVVDTTEAAVDVVEEVAAEVKKAAETVVEVVEAVAEIPAEVIEEVQELAAEIQESVSEVTEEVSAVAEVVEQAVSEVVEVVEEAVAEVVEVVAETPAVASEAVEVVEETAVEVVEAVAEVVEVAESVAEVVEDAAEAVVEEVAAVADSIAESIEEISDAVQEVVVTEATEVSTLAAEIETVQSNVNEIIAEVAEQEVAIETLSITADGEALVEASVVAVESIVVDDVPAVETPEVEIVEAPAETIADAEIVTEVTPVEEVVDELVVEDYPEIPPEVPYVIVGGGTAAYAAVRAIRKYDPAAKVLILSKEVQAPYNRTPLSKEMWFTSPDKSSNATYENWKGKEVSIYHEKEEFYCTTKELQSRKDYGGTALLLNATVDKLEPNEKKVVLKNGAEIKYDKVLIAVGGQPKSLPVFDEAEEAVQNRVTKFRSVDDFWKLEKLSRQEPGEIVIVGSGFLGTELAYALGERSKSIDGLSVTQVCRESGVLGAVLPLHLSNYASTELEKNNVKVVRNAQISSVNMVDEKMKLNLTDGREVTADHAILAVGVDVDNKLAARSGLEHDPARGGFIVNSELESRRDVFVAGDAANFYDIRLGRRRVEHYDHAIVTGRLAGENMTGKRKAYSHQSMFWSDIGPDIGFEAIGLVDSRLKSVSVFADHSGGDILKDESTSDKKYDRGVVFYTRNDTVVGVVTWNIFNKMGIARRLIALEQQSPDYAELAKLFDVNKV